MTEDNKFLMSDTCIWITYWSLGLAIQKVKMSWDCKLGKCYFPLLTNSDWMNHSPPLCTCILLHKYFTGRPITNLIHFAPKINLFPWQNNTVLTDQPQFSHLNFSLQNLLPTKWANFLFHKGTGTHRALKSHALSARLTQTNIYALMLKLYFSRIWDSLLL